MTRATTLPQPLTRERAPPHRHGLREVLGAEAWNRLPDAVRERFADTVAETRYAGTFEVVQASALGRLFSWLGILFGTPVAPRTGSNVEARVRVFPGAHGVVWERDYRWADGANDVVQSTKVVTDAGELIEMLPARLCMPLHTYERDGVLHFASRGYYFDLGFGLKLRLPGLFSPGATHVEHIDLGHGWFRFTMTVTHPVFGILFFQSGRFCAAEYAPPDG